MFFLYNLERQVTLHPSYFGRNMHELVTGKLLKDVEGTCTGRYYIITVMDTFDVSEGRILPGTGLAEFTVRYRAVVWRPFKGETVGLSKIRFKTCRSLQISVTGRCNRHWCQLRRILGSAGPLQLFVSKEVTQIQPFHRVANRKSLFPKTSSSIRMLPHASGRTMKIK